MIYNRWLRVSIFIMIILFNCFRIFRVKYYYWRQFYCVDGEIGRSEVEVIMELVSGGVRVKFRFVCRQCLDSVFQYYYRIFFCSEYFGVLGFWELLVLVRIVDRKFWMYFFGVRRLSRQLDFQEVVVYLLGVWRYFQLCFYFSGNRRRVGRLVSSLISRRSWTFFSEFRLFVLRFGCELGSGESRGFYMKEEWEV